MNQPPTIAPYDQLGIGYDATRHADPYILARLAHWLAPSAQGRYLDAGCGTGNYTVGLAAHGGRWVGVDASARMLTEAARKSGRLAWVQGDLLALPFAAAAFDGVVATLVVHHLRSLAHGYANLARVTVPGGRLVLFTSTAEQMTGYWLNHYFPQAMARSIAQMPSQVTLDAVATATGWREIGREPYLIQPQLADGFLYRGKHHPRWYLDAEVRRGISTFAALEDPADVAEVERGCARLAAELESGAFEEVAARHASELGDYLVLTYAHGGRDAR